MLIWKVTYVLPHAMWDRLALYVESYTESDAKEIAYQQIMGEGKVYNIYQRDIAFISIVVFAEY